MGAFLEPLIYVLRFGKDAEKYGDDYTGLGVVLNLGGGKCKIVGFVNAEDDPSPVATMVEIGRCLREAGFREITWERKRLDGLEPAAIKL